MPAAVWLAAHGDEVGPRARRELLERYGTRAEVLLAETDGHDDAARSRTTRLHARGDRVAASRNERVVHLIDLVLRRTSIAFTGAPHGAAPRRAGRPRRRTSSAGIASAAAEEVEATRRLLAERHGVRLDQVVDVGLTDSALAAAGPSPGR